MASWGNQAGTKYDQDMESPTGGGVTHRHLVVTKNSNDDDAITANNTSTGMALKVNGKAKFVNNQGVGEAVKIESATMSSALVVSGKTEISTNSALTALEVENDTGTALDVIGNAKVTANSAEKSLWVLNSNLNNHALYVEGKTRMTINTLVDHDALTVVNEQTNGPGGLKCHCPLKLRLQLKFYETESPSYIDSSVGNDLLLNTIAAVGANIQLGRSSGANKIVLGTLEAHGPVDIDNTLDLDVNTADVAMDVNNANAGATATGIKATGSIALDARGHIAIESDKGLSLDGLSRQNYIIYHSASSRMEFYIGGILRFVIDSTGGHNP